MEIPATAANMTRATSIVRTSFRCLSMKACCRFPVSSTRRSMLTCSSSGRPVSVCGRRSGDPTTGSLACSANAVFFNQLRAATVAAGARAAIESAAAATFGAGIFFDAPQKAGARADGTVISGHDAMGTAPEVSAADSRRAIPFSGYTPFAEVARGTTW